jgi:hypothetical protein
MPGTIGAPIVVVRRQDGVDADGLGAKLHRQRLGEPDQAALLAA